MSCHILLAVVWVQTHQHCGLTITIIVTIAVTIAIAVTVTHWLS